MIGGAVASDLACGPWGLVGLGMIRSPVMVVPTGSPIQNLRQVVTCDFAEERASEIKTDCVCVAQHGVADCGGGSPQHFLS